MKPLLALLLAATLHAAERPRLQIINGSSEPVEVFWLKSDTERVPNGTVAPGQDTIITTTIGHRFAIVGRGAEETVASEVPVQAFRFGGVPAFYTQSVSAGGYPIVASGKVNPYALKEVAYLVDLMLAKRPDVRVAMIKSGSRMCILAHDEFTTDQPEWAHLTPKDYRDARARGMGGSPTDPYCSCAEENVLGYPGDPYAAECIVIHEFAHNIHLRGMTNVDATFDARVKAAYYAAMKAGLWKAAYASTNHHEYFAEGVQCWFDNNRENDNEHNHVNTRAELLAYDPALAALCREVFGDTELKYTKPATRLTGHLAGYDPAKAPTFAWPERLKKVKAEISAKVKARNEAANKPRPNVLFIAVDDMRCDLGCYGVKHVQSPNLDKLAASGVLFTRAYCQQAVCNPSRVSLMTGLRPDTTKVWDLDTDFRTTIPDAVTIPQHFRKHGYRAEAFGKIFHNTFPDDVSWDEPTHMAKGVVNYSAENAKRLADLKARMKSDGKPARAIARMRGPATEAQEQPDDMNFDGKQTADALAKLRELASGKSPFFLAVGYIRPHLPFITPKKYWDLYDRANIPLATNPFFPRGMPPVAFGDRSLGGLYEMRDYMDYSGAPSPFERSLTEAQQRELKHGYYASVSFIDAQVGRLLAGLDELGLAKNTVVVLWSDHGWKLGEHNGWCKQTNYEIDTRAPLMIRAPGAKANGQRCDSLVEFVDIYPTLCDIAGLPVPDNLAGESLAPLLSDATAKVKDAAFSQFPRKQDGRDYMGYAMRTERYRYVEWLEAGSGKIAARELYDHDSDPDENENIANGSPLTDELSAQMWKTLKPAPRFDPVVRDIEGWKVYVEPALLDGAHREEGAQALAMLANHLQRIKILIPAQPLARLQQVGIWIEHSHPELKSKQYHPSLKWLVAHGHDPRLEKKVHIPQARDLLSREQMLKHPAVILHELAHAYHDQVLGFDHAEIAAAYEKAKKSGTYENVLLYTGKRVKHYGLTTRQEYFAEATEAYFYRNDFYPFVRAELQEHDPEMCALLGRLWGEVK